MSYFNRANVVQVSAKSKCVLNFAERSQHSRNKTMLILSYPFNPLGWGRGRNSYRKNKSTEKNPESEEDLLQHRTDGTDAFDTLYIRCEKFSMHDF